MVRPAAGGQIEGCSNINATVIGDYRQPAIRLPEAGRAPEIASSARETIVILRQHGRATREFTLVAIHPGVPTGQAIDATGRPLKVAPALAVTEPANPAELHAPRNLVGSGRP